MEATEEADIINSHPIKEGLVAFRLQVASSQAGLDFVGSSRAVEDILSENLVLDLIGALLTFSAARVLRSRIDRKTHLRADLFGLGSKVGSSNFDIKSTIPLVKLVVNNASDSEIWRAVFDLIALTSPKQSTPPRAFEKADFDTPLRSSSASQKGMKQTHDEVDRRIIEELTGRVYDNVGGFYERYFEDKDWSNNAKDIYEESRAQYAEDHWSGWPEPALQDLFFDWFMRFQDTFFSGLRHRYYTLANKVLRGSEADRKLDIFLAPADAAFKDAKHDWSSVLVIGEHKRNADEDRSIATLVQLAGYAREVFGSQPDRRFVPGFTICGSVMRLWVFDRSGSYNSGPFDIHQNPERFIRAIAGYALMTDAELGLNTFIKRDGNSKYILARNVRIYIEDKPIASTKAIVCRGTTCYRGRRGNSTDWEYVVKFAWPSNKRQREGRLLKLAKDRGVTGIAEWFNHEQITIDGDPDTTSHLRQAMKFGAQRKLSSKALWVDSGTESSRASRTRSLRGRSKSSMGRLTGLGISTSSTPISSSGQKRKRDEGLVTGRAEIKRSKSGDGQTDVTDHNTKAYESSTHIVHSVEEAEAYGNRIHCCLVVSPAGRPLHAYTSVRELLEALRDAIAGHKSLLEVGKILHRDISENNIIITESASDGTPKGRLIDLDLAKELNSVPSGASHRTGTMQFMAIEVLQGKGHTYRHDLESFFYVFIWMCIRYGHEDVDDLEKVTAPRSGPNKRRVRPTTTSILRDWYTGDYRQIANTKRGHMVGFEDITAEFAPEFCGLKDLAEELRNVLFPIHGKLFIGTYKDRSIMYEGMITAFNRAISHLE